MIEQHQLVLTRGNYSDYFVHKEQRDSTAIKKNENLLKDIHHLKQTRQAKSQWAQQAENEKKNNSHADKGFIGAKAAKMMKKATIMKGRLDTAIEERKGLLKEIENVVPLTINVLPTNHQLLLSINDLTLSYPTKQLCSNITTTIEKMSRSCSVGIMVLENLVLLMQSSGHSVVSKAEIYFLAVPLKSAQYVKIILIIMEVYVVLHLLLKLTTINFLTFFVN